MSSTQSTRPAAVSEPPRGFEPHPRPAYERYAALYVRFALAAGFLSAVADRFGLWGKEGGWKNFANFTHYTAQVLSFAPSSSIPFFAWAATAGETVFGIALIAGLWLRWTALGSAVLLLLFALSMAISFGPKSPLDYSVFAASAAAALLAASEQRAFRGASKAR